MEHAGAHYDRAVTFFAALTDNITLRLLRSGDADAVAQAYTRNRQHLAPWEPERAEEFFTTAHQSTVVTTQLEHYEAGTGLPLVLSVGEHIVGRVNLSNIVRGPFQSASVGYWIDASHTGRGLASAAVEALVAYSRDELGLHRLEASVLLHNAASRRVLERAGFQSIGVAPTYLQIAGLWQDHLLTQRILY
ncbi:[SSU ribosomal protein S5P]-alanine acetyltransferase [Agreia bicolorata]|uniref:[SSU ribosomal protein S5P]-alanine acetyltransferase n=1 Tax=Agreia bicolorata TaxID=110935 RepID=A0A1T4XR02_9MICO|nr:[SSU ribosomal protein S5P]-alanine acetyltransferase [Agreia bicolorata]